MDLLGLERGCPMNSFRNHMIYAYAPHHWVCLVGISDTKNIVTNPWVGQRVDPTYRYQHQFTHPDLKEICKKKSLLQQPGDSKWRPFDSLVGGHWTSETVTFSPSQKGHQQNCQEGELFSTSLWFPAKKKHYTTRVFQPIQLPLQLIWLVSFLRWKRTLSSNFLFRVTGQRRDSEEKKAFKKKSGMVTKQMDVSKNKATPKLSSSLIGCSFINHPFWGTPILGNPQIKVKLFLVKRNAMGKRVGHRKNSRKRTLDLYKDWDDLLLME